MDWLDLLAVQRTLKCLLQHHSPRASILRRSAFFTVQLSHSYMTTGKTIALTRRTFVGKVMSLLFNVLSGVFYICSNQLVETDQVWVACLSTSRTKAPNPKWEKDKINYSFSMKNIYSWKRYYKGHLKWNQLVVSHAYSDSLWKYPLRVKWSWNHIPKTQLQQLLSEPLLQRGKKISFN